MKPKIKTMYEMTIFRLERKGVMYLRIPDLRGQPYYIVEDKEGKCPDGEAEKFYGWGMMFSPLGELTRTWGELPK